MNETATDAFAIYCANILAALAVLLGIVWVRVLPYVRAAFQYRAQPVRVREYHAMPWMLPERALPKYRTAWEFCAFFCCGQLASVDLATFRMKCAVCGQSEATSPLAYQTNDYALLGARFYQERRAFIERTDNAKQ